MTSVSERRPLAGRYLSTSAGGVHRSGSVLWLVYAVPMGGVTRSSSHARPSVLRHSDPSLLLRFLPPSYSWSLVEPYEAILVSLQARQILPCFFFLCLFLDCQRGQFSLSQSFRWGMYYSPSYLGL
ncbi:hypothetical protein FKM82_013113 [Ascaphus truei]